MICNSSLYGDFRRTRTFSEIYPDETAFKADYDMGMSSEYTITETQAGMLYYLLLSRYANSHIASSDENRFKLQVAALIMQYGPTWIKELDTQKAIRALSLDELRESTNQIANHAYNPSSGPDTGDDGYLQKIDQQNVMIYKKSKPEAYITLLGLLEKDVTEEFLRKFRNLFIQFVEPERPLFYESEVLF